MSRVVQVIITESEWKRMRVTCTALELTQQEFVRQAIEEKISEWQANRRGETNRKKGGAR